MNNGLDNEVCAMVSIRRRSRNSGDGGCELDDIVGTSPKSIAALEQALAEAVAPSTRDAVLAWQPEARDRLVALRFEQPSGELDLRVEEIESLLAVDVPAPAAVWASPNRGVTVVFAEADGATAMQIAGAWWLLAKLGRLREWPVVACTEVDDPHGLGASVHRATPSAHIAMSSFDAPELACGPRPDLPSLYEAARSLVHLGHERHVLKALYSQLPAELMQPAWSLVLRVVNADRLGVADEEERTAWRSRVVEAGSPALDIARSTTGAWLDARTLQPRCVSATHTLRYLPSVFAPPAIDRAAASGPLDGFATLHALSANQVVGPFVGPPRGAVFARRVRATDDPPPVDVRARPSPGAVEEAWTTIATYLPGISRGYVSGLIAAAYVGQRGVATPPLICGTGQTGSSKTAQVHLVAGMIGTTANVVMLGASDDAARRFGLALESGAGLIFVDEIGRVTNLTAKVETLLVANSKIAYRAKYSNEREASVRAAVVLLGSTMPTEIVASPEIARRSVGYRLDGADKVWSLIDAVSEGPLDLAQCRRVPALRTALDTITSHVWWSVKDIGPAGDWRALLKEKFGGVDIAELDLGMDPAARAQAIVEIYELFRRAAKRELSTTDGWSGWLVARDGSAVADKLNVLVEPAASKPGFKAQAAELERLNLAPILGFDAPHLQLLVRLRGRRRFIKFVQASARKGGGMPRERWPAAVPGHTRQVEGAP